MRLDELLNNRSRNISKAKYKRLKSMSFFPVAICSIKDGWDTTELDSLTEAEAKKKLHRHWQMKRYEEAKGIQPHKRTITVHVVHDDKDEPKPEWPEELNSMNINNFPVAYLCNKFNIEPQGI